MIEENQAAMLGLKFLLLKNCTPNVLTVLIGLVLSVVVRTSHAASFCS